MTHYTTDNGYETSDDFEYDKTDPLSIESYSKKLIGKTFNDVIDNDKNPIIRDPQTKYGTDAVRNKGNLGQIIEERFFHYLCNSDQDPDFSEAGVELKVTPYRINKNGSFSAKERLVLTMIGYLSVVDETFETSHFWHKSGLLLLIYYLYEENLNRLDYRIDYSKLFHPPEQDIKIIRQDFEKIVEKIRSGKAHELSESDTLYLSACTKSSTSDVRTRQPFSDIPAKPRAFAYKSSYMTYVLNNYIIPGKDTYEPIIKDGKSEDSFEDYIVSRIGQYSGRTIDSLCDEFGISGSAKAKNLGALIAYKILGISGNKAEEFEKANVVVKTIRIGKNNKIKECMSFPTFRFKELVEETWDDSTFGNYLRETRFLFIVYKFDENNVLRLRGCQFWNIPYSDLENDVKEVWEKTVDILKEGLQITTENGIQHTNLPKMTENRVSHVRPHGKDSRDTDELPDGRKFTKQCFWLNNTYIYEQLDERLK